MRRTEEKALLPAEEKGSLQEVYHQIPDEKCSDKRLKGYTQDFKQR
jgi:hypothetical protein